MMTKTCTKCGEVKPLEAFCKNKNAKDGLKHTCRDCSKISISEWKNKNPDKVKELANNYGNSLKRLEGGKKKYFLGLINKIKKADPNDRQSILQTKRDLEGYAKSHGLDLSDDDYTKYKKSNDDRAAQIAKQNAVSKKRKDARLSLAAKKNNIDLDKITIKNPETGNDITLRSALGYDEKHPVYQSALAKLKQAQSGGGNTKKTNIFKENK